MKRLMMLGPPGAGKGTQAQKLAVELNLPQISTGDLLRAAKKNQTDLGKEAAPYMDNGKLVPDELVIGMVVERLKASDAQEGYIFDGFPRTLKQAETLEEMEISLDHVISIVVADEEVHRRLEARRTCSECKAIYHLIFSPPKSEDRCDQCGAEGTIYQRADDTPEKIDERLRAYKAQTETLIAFYEEKGRLIQIDGQGDPAEVKKRIQKALQP